MISKGSTIKRRIIKNTFINGFSMLLIAGVGFILMPYMIAKLGVVEYGLIGIVNLFSFAGYIGLLDMGFQVSIVKYVAEYKEKNQREKLNQLATTTLSIFIIISIVAAVISILFVNVFVTRILKIPELYISSFKLALSLIFITYLFEFPNIIFTGILEGLQRYDILKGLQVVSYVLYAATVFVLLSAGYGYMAVVLLMVILSIIKFSVSFIFCFKQLPFLKINRKYLSLNILKEIGKMTKLIFISRIASIINSKSDQIFIGIFLGPVFMTSYQIIVKLPQVLKTVLGFGNSAVFPVASELQATDNKGLLRKLFLRGWRFNLFVFIPIITGAIYFSRPFIVNWVGMDFNNLVPLQRIYISQYLFFLLIAFGSTMLVGMNKDLNKITRINVAGTVLKITLISLLINKMQLMGIVVAMFCSMVLPMPFMIKLILREFDIGQKRYILEVIKIFLVTVIPLSLFYLVGDLVPLNNMAVVIAEGIVWCVLFWIPLYLFVIDNESRKLVRGILNRVLLGRKVYVT